jgi:hypothetical protein
MMDLESLIREVESSVQWRADKATEYPNDRRSRTSADSLSRLAKNLRGLPPDNEYVRAYEAAIDRLVALEVDWGEYTSRQIGRYGFDYPLDGDPKPFLEHLTEHYHGQIAEAEKKSAEAERERAYKEACEAADEQAKEAAAEQAREIAEEAAKEAAERAYKEAYDEAYKEAYDEAYKEALIEAVRG